MSDKRKAGRPPIYGVRLKSRTVKLDEATLDRAREIGGGNLSEGIRRAVEKANPHQVHDAQKTGA